MMPIPKYLYDIALSKNCVIDDTPFVADVRCPCGSLEFEILFPGETHSVDGKVIPCTAHIQGRFFFLIVVECAHCHRKHLLFDKDYHGWDGVVNHDTVQAAIPRPPLSKWKCQNCSSLSHSIVVSLQTEGEDSLNELDDEEAKKFHWEDCFGYFNMDISCGKCNMKTIEFVGYETM